ncbi:MAG: hypothetical protein QOI83_2322 [Streptomycetaceae bacterium]|nr:hypothetical protein [Streptomycetaceae bacterium]
MKTISRSVPSPLFNASSTIRSVRAHPWTGMQISAGWGSGNKLRYVTVQPNLVAEVRADTAVDRGRHRHPVRYLRIRDDLTPGDIAAAG